jgi:hypothetical protein
MPSNIYFRKLTVLTPNLIGVISWIIRTYIEEYIFPVKPSQGGVKRLSQEKCIGGSEVIYSRIFAFKYSGG